MLPEPKLIPPSDQCIESFASVPHTPQQNMSRHQTKSLIPQELNQSQQNASTQPVFAYLVSPQQYRLCLLYNCESTPGCSFKFKHICSLCTNDPHATDKHHKAVVCPHHPIPSSNGNSPKKNGIHPGFITDPIPTTDKYVSTVAQTV